MQTDREKELWRAHWLEKRTPWDMGRAHPDLERLLQHAAIEGGLAAGGRFFSAGCGRAHNEARIAQLGYQVTAMDMAPEAIDEARSLYGSFPQLKLQAGDLFRFQDDQGFDAVFDRAMLCALQAGDRPAYIKKIKELLSPTGLFCSILFRSVNAELVGPPFAIDERSAWDLLGGDFQLSYAAPAQAAFPFVPEEWLCIWRRRPEEVPVEI